MTLSLRQSESSVLAATACILLLMLSSCGGSKDTTQPASNSATQTGKPVVDVGERPRRIAGLLSPGTLREDLLACDTSSITSQSFSIGHRGAPLGYPEHTRESYLAAARQGAGAIECDVTFTADKALVCRHSQCDLHSSTNILETPLAGRCMVPPDYNSGQPFANARCCTSDLTLDEFYTLEGRHDVINQTATTLSDYYAPAADRVVTGGPDRGTLLSHAESVALLDALGVAMIPELKSTDTTAGAVGFSTRAALADRLVADYAAAGIDPARVSVQSFIQSDLDYLRSSAPAYADNLILLDDRYRDEGFDPLDSTTWVLSMQELVATGLSRLAPPFWVLLTLDEAGEIVPSPYAIAARAAGLDLVTWTLERSGSLEDGGGFYYQSIRDAIDDESDMLRVLDVLAREIGVSGVFSDWPATTTWYAHCRQ